MKQTQSELLNYTTTSNTTDSNNSPSTSQIIKREPIPNTGFELISTEQGHFIALGQFRLTQQYQTRETALETVEKHDWELIIGLIGACIQAQQQFDKLGQHP